MVDAISTPLEINEPPLQFHPGAYFQLREVDAWTNSWLSKSALKDDFLFQSLHFAELYSGFPIVL
jgi:hypothetical protein